MDRWLQEKWRKLQHPGWPKELLEPHFRMISEPEKVPFVIRETMHKYQHSLSEVTLWERRS
ncbi:hypothetical protein HORIV_66720 [Vreelandella olivaria]|uniref:Uncharacterized protein n=1 Tax=Vreelandella olivaria TaxID=390919 RepID=A0ABN5X4Y0_9GAMM|nr:hypothetical protein HORIV_66720 [Halomonas olivaria]